MLIATICFVDDRPEQEVITCTIMDLWEHFPWHLLEKLFDFHVLNILFN